MGAQGLFCTLPQHSNLAISYHPVAATMCSYCCPECCFEEQCNCRCGESFFMVGVVVFLAAGVFWVMGETIPIFHNQGFHGLNMLFFNIALVLMVGGLVYAFVARKGAAFSREKKKALLSVD